LTRFQNAVDYGDDHFKEHGYPVCSVEMEIAHKSVPLGGWNFQGHGRAGPSVIKFEDMAIASLKLQRMGGTA
jgi:hypothetical protein